MTEDYPIDFEREMPFDGSNPFPGLLHTIGWTPVVPLDRTGEGTGCEIYGKLEFFNPGGSIKDRIALSMVRHAEVNGDLKPGGTIIESTSGNTGMGLAIVSAVLGYRLMITIPDKMSQEKIDMMKAMGAEVYVCPTSVEPDDPKSYYSTAKRLEREIPEALYINQYDNPANPEVHYRTTGPEILTQMNENLDAFVCGIGTGGTITGVGRYLQEQDPEIEIVGVDPEGSLYKEYFEKGELGEAKTYQVEGIGEDMIPEALDFSVVDRVMQFGDRESFLAARELARTEGIFAGGSAGTAIHAAKKYAEQAPEGTRILVIIPDTGERYLSKFYSDEWMKENQFFPATVSRSAGDLLEQTRRGPKKLISLNPADTVGDALEYIREYEISQIPVLDDGGNVTGMVYETPVIDVMLHEERGRELPIQAVIQEVPPIIEPDTPIDEISHMLAEDQQAVLVDRGDGYYGVITKYDLVSAISDS